MDTQALSKIGYGLYVVTVKDGTKMNGLVVNSVMQISTSPNTVAVSVSKQNHSYGLILQNQVFNVCCLSTDAPFALFERFGFASGKNVNKFDQYYVRYAKNGVCYLPRYSNAYISLEVLSHVDCGTHGLFICKVTDAEDLNGLPTMTYDYYHENVKPKASAKASGYVCNICGYYYEGEALPDGFICPICKHGAADFEPLD